MINNYDLDNDFGMDSPVSLDGVEKQIKTFEDSRLTCKVLHKSKKSIRRVRVNLKELKEKENIKVTCISFMLSQKNLQSSLLKNSKISSTHNKIAKKKKKYDILTVQKHSFR